MNVLEASLVEEVAEEVEVEVEERFIEFGEEEEKEEDKEHSFDSLVTMRPTGTLCKRAPVRDFNADITAD